MNYELSDRARTVLAEREIPSVWVERVLAEPEKVEDDPDDAELEHRLGRIKEHENSVLRVIINKTASSMRVVTVYFDRAMRNRL